MIANLRSQLVLKADDSILIKCVKLYGKLLVYSLFMSLLVGLVLVDVFRKTSK